MSLPFDDETLRILNALPQPALLRFARRQGLSPADDGTKAQIIAELQQACPGVVHDHLRPALQLNVSDLRETQADDLAAQLKDLKEELSSAWEDKLKAGQESIATVRWVIGIAGTFFGIIIVGGGFLAGRKLDNLDSELKARGEQIREQLATTRKLADDAKTIAIADRQLEMQAIATSADDLLLTFSLTRPNKQTERDLRRYLNTLNQLAATPTGPGATNGDANGDPAVVLFLRNVVEAALVLETQKSERDPMRRKEAIAVAEEKWSRIESSSASTVEYLGDFPHHCRAYRLNVLGVLSIFRADLADSEKGPLLKQAEDYFTKAREEAERVGFRFTRPLSNLGLVASRRRDNLLATHPEQDVEPLFQQELTFVETAIRDEYQPALLALLYNNQASMLLDHTRYLRERGQFDSARNRLVKGTESIRNALEIPSVHPAAYVTKAELVAEEILLDRKTKQSLPAGEEAARTAECLGWLKKAARNQYTGLTGRTIAKIFEDMKSLGQVCSIKEPAFEELRRGIELLAESPH